MPFGFRCDNFLSFWVVALRVLLHILCICYVNYYLQASLSLRRSSIGLKFLKHILFTFFQMSWKFGSPPTNQLTWPLAAKWPKSSFPLIHVFVLFVKIKDKLADLFFINDISLLTIKWEQTDPSIECQRYNLKYSQPKHSIWDYETHNSLLDYYKTISLNIIISISFRFVAKICNNIKNCLLLCHISGLSIVEV